MDDDPEPLTARFENVPETGRAIQVTRKIREKGSGSGRKSARGPSWNLSYRVIGVRESRLAGTVGAAPTSPRVAACGGSHPAQRRGRARRSRDCGSAGRRRVRPGGWSTACGGPRRRGDRAGRRRDSGAVNWCLRSGKRGASRPDASISEQVTARGERPRLAEEIGRGAFDPMQRLSAGGQIRAAGFGQHDALRPALEERATQVILERPNLLAHRWGRHVERLGRPGEGPARAAASKSRSQLRDGTRRAMVENQVWLYLTGKRSMFRLPPASREMHGP